MENLEEEKLVVSEEIRSYIYETAKWTKFLAIVGLVFAAFLALTALSANGILEQLTVAAPTSPLVELGANFLTVYFLAISLILFYPSFLMLKYSNAANTAVLYADQEQFTIATQKMKSIFKFWGIITIIILSLNILSVIMVVVSQIGGAAQ